MWSIFTALARALREEITEEEMLAWGWEGWRTGELALFVFGG